MIHKLNLILVLLLIVSTMSCDIDQTQKTKLPDVDVDVDPGQLPAFDVDWAEVNVGTKTQTVTVPKVVVVMEEVEIEVPYVEVDMPGETDKEEHTITVQAEVTDIEHSINIEKVYATGKRLFVISRLTKKSQSLKGQKMRVSDQLVLNAPDLDVKHYIIGTKPAGSFNNQYTYISSEQQIASKLTKGKIIYSK